MTNRIEFDDDDDDGQPIRLREGIRRSNDVVGQRGQ